MKSVLKLPALLLLLLLGGLQAAAVPADKIVRIEQPAPAEIIIATMSYCPAPDTTSFCKIRATQSKGTVPNIYTMPYSLTANYTDWNRLWVNTGVLAGAFVGTLLVLECLPEDATSWNRAEIQKDPPMTRWVDNIFRRGPEWDHDNPVFNYVLHPYAGAAYFMSARSCGFNFWRSFLYCSIISTVGWEFGIEACMERPSYQDIVITPVVGSILGEVFYKLKRKIVSNDYTLGDSRLLGNIVVFLIDPVNEVINLFRGSNTRRLHLGRKASEVSSVLMPRIGRGSFGFTLSCTF